uniref:Lipase_3 domain-containing protein n=1 Tax=Syphacia muris TaxID=451379 RepID=A0A0N5AK44_9BILA
LQVTGISLGGTLATLASHVVVVKRIFKRDKIKLITYGEPRVFDREFSKIHDYMVPYSYRVVYGRDLIPHLAPLFLGFYHRRYEVYHSRFI